MKSIKFLKTYKKREETKLRFVSEKMGVSLCYNRKISRKTKKFLALYPITQFLAKPLVKKLIEAIAIAIITGVSTRVISIVLARTLFPKIQVWVKQSAPNLNEKEINRLCRSVEIVTELIILAVASTIVASLIVRKFENIGPVISILDNLPSEGIEFEGEDFDTLSDIFKEEHNNFFSEKVFESFRSFDTFQKLKFRNLINILIPGDGELGRLRNLELINRFTTNDVATLSRIVLGFYFRWKNRIDFLSLPIILRLYIVKHPLDEKHLEKVEELKKLLQAIVQNKAKFILFFYRTGMSDIRKIYYEITMKISKKGTLGGFLKYASMHLTRLEHAKLLFLIRLFYLLLDLYGYGSWCSEEEWEQVVSYLEYLGTLLKRVPLIPLVPPKGKDMAKIFESKYGKKPPFPVQYINYGKKVLIFICLKKGIYLLIPKLKDSIPFSKLLNS